MDVGEMARGSRMRNGRDYLDSLDDGRAVYLGGRRVEAVLDHKAYVAPASRVAETYERQATGDIEFTLDPPRSVEDLRAGAAIASEVDGLTSVTMEALKMLHTAHMRLGGTDFEHSGAISSFARRAIGENLRIAQCITDAKGDRSLPPARQLDPEAFLRVVARRDDGVVIRGAKMHVTGASLVHVLLVMPTKSMKPGEEDYAIAAAVDVAQEGVRIIDVSYTPEVSDDRHFPYSRWGNPPTGTVIFDDVFVPHDRIFLNGQTADAAVFAHSLGLWLRANGTALMADAADLLVGLAEMVAESNGTLRVPHVREKLAEMIVHATLVRAGLEAALANPTYEADGAVAPDELYTNVAKYQAAAHYPLMVRHLHDIAGGGVVSAPSTADAEHEEVGELIRRYFTASPTVDGMRRLELFHLIRDLTADRHGGWQQVGNLHGAGGLHAQRLVARRHYNMDAARARVTKLLVGAALPTPTQGALA